MAKCPYCGNDLKLEDYIVEGDLKIAPPKPFGKADSRPIACRHCGTLLGFS